MRHMKEQDSGWGPDRKAVKTEAKDEKGRYVDIYVAKALDSNEWEAWGAVNGIPYGDQTWFSIRSEEEAIERASDFFYNLSQIQTILEEAREFLHGESKVNPFLSYKAPWLRY